MTATMTSNSAPCQKVTLAMIRGATAAMKAKLQPATKPANASASPAGNLGTLAYTPPTAADVTRALSALDPDSPYEDWRNVVWSVLASGLTNAEALAEAWSCRGTKWDEGAFRAVVGSFDPSKPGAVGVGTLFHYAQQAQQGHQKALQAPVAVAARQRYKLLSVADVAALPTLPWLIKGLLPRHGLAALYGPSGSGKSFLALELAGCVVAGRKWFGMTTKQAPVVYVMLEGEGAIRNRVAALEVAHGSLPRAGFSLVVQPFTLTTAQDVADLAAVLPRGAVVFIDTLNRAAPTADENSSKEMGQIIEGAKALQAYIGGLVVLVHHTGKDTTKGLRGHSSLHAALDAAIEVERDAKGTRTWSVAKAKDGEDGKRVAFKLVQHALGRDADGDEISSCSVAPDSSAIFVKPEPSGRNQKLALKAIKAALSGPQATTGVAACPAGTACLMMEYAVAASAASLTTVDKKKRVNTARNTVNSLIQGGFLESGLDAAGEAWCWLT
jgi:RecA/RadA recombinase